MTPPNAPPVSEEHRHALTPYFDAGYYLSSYPDVRLSGMDPLEHYCQAGWQEGRDPSPWFNTRHYLRLYEDVAAAAMNPLLHYAWAGRQEGRQTIRPLDAWRSRLAGTRPAKEAAADWIRIDRGAERLGQKAVTEALQALSGDARLLVSISHDDYAVNVGGVQNVINDEQQASQALGWHYLHLCPAQPLPILAPEAVSAREFYVSVRLDRQSVGFTDMATLLRVLETLRPAQARTEVILHHLMGHSPELIQQLCAALRCETPRIWVHDSFTICESYTLLRNDVVYCHGPAETSSACGVCSYGADRPVHRRRIRALFEAVRATILAPSEVALQSWLKISGLPHAEASVVPLGRMVMAPSRIGWGDGSAERPVRVGYLGMRTFHKGWPVFQDLALRLAADPRYTFVQLGSGEGPALPGDISHVPVRVTRDTRNAMTEAVATANLDVVVVWALWPETFCFVVHEALAGGAFVVTHPGAGNVGPAFRANAPAQGIEVPDPDALFELFHGGEVLKRLADADRQKGALILGRGTVDWLCVHTGGDEAVLSTAAWAGDTAHG